MTLTPQQFKGVLDAFLGLHGTDEGGNEPNSAAAFHVLRALCGANVADVPCLSLVAEPPGLLPHQEEMVDQLGDLFSLLAVKLWQAARRSRTRRDQREALKRVQRCQSSTKPSVTG